MSKNLHQISTRSLSEHWSRLSEADQLYGMYGMSQWCTRQSDGGSSIQQPMLPECYWMLHQLAVVFEQATSDRKQDNCQLLQRRT